MSQVDIQYQQLVDTIKQYNPQADMALIENAFRFAEQAHCEQIRLSGEPFILHPLAAAQNLAELKLDSQAIAAGLLHDVLEDTATSEEELREVFGKDVSYLVQGVSNLQQVKFQEKNQYIENLRKMFVATAKDVRVLLIRMCDRLHNIRTLEFKPLKEQKRIAQETLEIYAPIAHRLQVGSLRMQLQDGAFKYLMPAEFHRLHNAIRENYMSREAGLKKAEEDMVDELEHNGINLVKFKYRIKGVYSLYKKLQRYDNDIAKVYDVVAIRIIVKTMPECYAAMGIVHSLFKPIKGRIKDYIARPKANGYRSLHTTVMLDNGDFMEIQFRTEEMDEEAEFGVAAHWLYKEQDEFPHRRYSIDWIEQLARIIKSIENVQDLESLKLDLFRDRIFVLTPKGDVIDLPSGATPIDFAYEIHTEMGNQMIRATVNGEPKPPQTELQNGDIVSIITDKNKKSPDVKWLQYVKTSYARSKIKAAHRKKLAKWQKDLVKSHK